MWQGEQLANAIYRPFEVYTVVAHGTTGSASASLELRVRKASGS